LQQNVFPDRGTVYDFYFVKQASGSWNNWIDRVDKAKNVIPKDAKVTLVTGRGLFNLVAQKVLKGKVVDRKAYSDLKESVNSLFRNPTMLQN